MKVKIVICMNRELGRRLSERAAAELGLPFVDVRKELANETMQDLIFEEFDVKKLRSLERRVIKSSLKKSLLFMEYDLFRSNQRLLEGVAALYLRVEKEKLDDKISKLNFSSRDKFLLERCACLELEDDEEKNILKIKQILGD